MNESEARIDYEEKIRQLNAKHREEVEHWKEKYDEVLREVEVLKLKWSVVEMIFKK